MASDWVHKAFSRHCAEAYFKCRPSICVHSDFGEIELTITSPSQAAKRVDLADVPPIFFSCQGHCLEPNIVEHRQ
jgi:hypothetical protein